MLRATPDPTFPQTSPHFIVIPHSPGESGDRCLGENGPEPTPDFPLLRRPVPPRRAREGAAGRPTRPRNGHPPPRPARTTMNTAAAQLTLPLPGGRQPRGQRAEDEPRSKGERQRAPSPYRQQFEVSQRNPIGGAAVVRPAAKATLRVSRPRLTAAGPLGTARLQQENVGSRGPRRPPRDQPRLRPALPPSLRDSARACAVPGFRAAGV
ncbi:uncharacterized protein LOC117062695 [Trachypithecus francoisi]|uniref:uncharacterized protein LOC117062695 n=1 Tax=Trachypithecus francoisi TaxID=54180 RepID=UPI00141B7AD0|nr:uncharacterized protein LOC117062695 [Trachypithecus francoisi]